MVRLCRTREHVFCRSVVDRSDRTAAAARASWPLQALISLCQLRIVFGAFALLVPPLRFGFHQPDPVTELYMTGFLSHECVRLSFVPFLCFLSVEKIHSLLLKAPYLQLLIRACLSTVGARKHCQLEDFL